MESILLAAFVLILLLDFDKQEKLSRERRRHTYYKRMSENDGV